MKRADLNVLYTNAARYNDADLLRVAVQNDREYARSGELRAYLSSLGDAIDLTDVLARIDTLLGVRPSALTRSSALSPPREDLFDVDLMSVLAEVVHWSWVSPCRVRFFGSEQAIGLIRQEVDPLSLEVTTPGLLGDRFGQWFSVSATPRVWLILSGTNPRINAELLQYDETVAKGQMIVGSSSAATSFRAANNTREPLASPSPIPSPVLGYDSDNDRYEPYAKRRPADRTRVIRARLIRVRPEWPGELELAAQEYVATRHNLVLETSNPLTMISRPGRPASVAGGPALLWEQDPFALALHDAGHCSLYKMQLQEHSSPQTVSWLVTYDARPAEVPSSVETRPREFTLVLVATNVRASFTFPPQVQPDIARVVMELLGVDMAWRFGNPGALSLLVDWERVTATEPTPRLERWDVNAMND